MIIISCTLALTEKNLAEAEIRMAKSEELVAELENALKNLAAKWKSMEIKKEQALHRHIRYNEPLKLFSLINLSKIVELEEELRVVGNNMKALEISEQESAQREESYEETIRDLTERLKAVSLIIFLVVCMCACLLVTLSKLGIVSAEIEKNLEERINVLTHHVKEAEQRATEAERQVSKLQNEVDHLEDDLLAEKERYKALSGELDQTFAELTGY
ncbi:Tropomyosin [Schistosoma japonicum]|nr:Tropomyosin [Schistosoma japonicum]